MRATYAAAERGHRDAGRCHTVVVPVCQDIDVLRLFLDSLVETVEESTQIIAVNDGSGEAAQELLHERLSAVKAVRDDVTYEILWHDRPEGCARSINEALRLAAGRYVYLVDSDLMLLPGWQSGLRATLDSADTVGMTGAVLLYPQTGGIQHCGIAFTASLGRHLLLNGRPETLPAGRYEVQAVVFALFAMKRAVLDEIGLLDEGFFNGYEDFDYQLRARAAGYRTVVDPAVRAYHWERSSGIHRASNRKNNLGRFWKRWGAELDEDLWHHLFDRLRKVTTAEGGPWLGVDLAEARADAVEFWRRLCGEGVDIPVRDLSHRVGSEASVLLPQVLPADVSAAPTRLLLLVDNFVRLLDNGFWLDRRTRLRPDDIVVDLYGNVAPAADLASSCWPGTKVR